MKTKYSVIRSIFFVIFVLFNVKISAQITTVNNYRNKNLLTIRESRGELEGSPYLFPDWKRGIVKFLSGEVQVSDNLNYDQLEDIVVTKGDDGVECVFNDPIFEFTFNDNHKVFRSGFLATKGITTRSFFEIIYDGKTKLIKKQGKVILESKTYNSATVTKKVEDKIGTYIVKEGDKPVAVKNNEKGLLGLLNHSEELIKFIREQKLNLKKDADMITLLTFYDSL